MKKLLLLLFITNLAKSEVPITNLPAYTGSQVGSTDVVPFVSIGNNTTAKLKLSDIFAIPSLQSPTFTGVLTVPTGHFVTLVLTGSLSVPSGSFSNGVVVSGPVTLGAFNTFQQHNLNTVTAPLVNCGSPAGATGCVKINLNSTAHFIPYY